MNNPKEQYSRRKNKYDSLYKKLSKKVNNLSHIRLITFLLGAGLTAYLYWLQFYFYSLLVLMIFSVVFIFFIVKHYKAKRQKEYYKILREINDRALERLAGKWKSFADTGEEFINEDHNFSYDLDLFGKGSLFQWINNAHTYIGRIKLHDFLTNPCDNADDIYNRQEAVKELSAKLDWRQKFTAEGKLAAENIKNPENLIAWSTKTNDFYLKKGVILGLKLLPFITVLLIVGFVLKILPYYIPLTFLVLQFLLIWPPRAEQIMAFNTAYEYRKDIKAYKKMIEIVENESFKAKYLKSLQKKLINTKKIPASKQIGILEKLVDSLSNRHNMFYIVFNLISLWDYQCRIALEKWKLEHGKNLINWLNAIGEFEALASLAVICFDNPSMQYPVIDNNASFSAKNLGHPLLTEDRVCNDLAFEPPAKVLLITGSNMSGKSTLLRTVGINLVLAYSGAPVCASKLTCSIREIYTSMRVKDNLEENISSFYAELLRVKRVVKACEEGKKILFLLDEIFKGTNSMDRHLGAEVLINKLSKHDVLGLVSTHDLELGDIEKTNDKVKNYHFREYYKDNQIFFDYKLRSGISTTRNAAYLMKMAGIDIDSDKILP